MCEQKTAGHLQQVIGEPNTKMRVEGYNRFRELQP